MFTELLGYKIFNGTKEELINLVVKKDKVNIISGNPQILYEGLQNESLFKDFTAEHSVIIPDGIGTLVACKLKGKKLKEKIAGIEVMDEVIKYCHENSKGIYLIGSKQEIVVAAKENLEKKYVGLKILGIHDGYFDINSCEELVKDLKEKKPYAVFVAMGCPRQEEFIRKYFGEINCSIIMGVGGSFDIVAEKLERAPQWMINIGCEWVYRVAKEPVRIKKLGSIPKFIVKAAVTREK